jgi:hypothetical protein
MGHTLHLGAPTVIEAYADRTPFGAVFEDDGKVAYFYAIDTRLGDHDNAVLDAVYIYHVTSVLNHPTPELDVYTPCDVEIKWSSDHQQVALLMNGYAHAAFDFEHKRAYCRTNFPSASRWSPDGHEWDQHAVDFLDALSADVVQPPSTVTMLR